MRTRLLISLLLALGAGACVSPLLPYQHSRYDYAAFRARVGVLAEPNYLPWVMHREMLPGGQPALVVCRWPDRAFPLRYYVVPPAIPSQEQDEFNPRDPEDYVLAVEEAFERWQQAVGRPVRFQRVADPEQATLQVHLDVALRQEEEGQVLGMLRDETGRCRVLGPGGDVDHVRIEFAVQDAYLFISDEFGLLTPGQVHVVALHEIGHILGASGQHSPLRGDVMYKIASDRRVEKLSEHDRNSFRALYRATPGAIYVRLNEKHAEPDTEVRRSPPVLDREYADERFGFRVRFPQGWQVMRSPRGWAAVDGLSWDYDASVQVIALRGDVVAYMQYRTLMPSAPDELVTREYLELDGRRMGRVTVRTEEWAEETAVLDWDEGWILLLVADCRNKVFSLYQPWFQRVLLSLEHPDAPEPQP